MELDKIQGGRIPTFTQCDRMRKAREFAGISSGDFADSIGVSRNTVSRYENGDHKPPRSLLILWQLRTGVPIEWMLYGDEDPPESEESRLRESNSRPSHYKRSPPRRKLQRVA